MSSLLTLRERGALVFNSIAWNGILESASKPSWKGSWKAACFLPPACALVEKQPLFSPNETLLLRPDDPLHTMKEKGVVLTPALGWEEGALGKLGKAVG